MTSINWRNFLYGIIAIITITLIIKLYLGYRNIETETDLEYIESFTSSSKKSSNKISNNKTSNDKISSINKFKDARNKSSNPRNNTRNNKRKNNWKSKLTFDDIITESENMNVEKYTMTNLKKSFWDYVGSFKSEKFANTTGSNSEALDKLYLFRDKFFEIFE